MNTVSTPLSNSLQIALSTPVKELCASIGSIGMMSFVRHICEMLTNIAMPAKVQSHAKFELVSLCYISGILSPRLRNFSAFELDVFVKRDSNRILERAVSAMRFYRSKTQFLDAVHLETDLDACSPVMNHNEYTKVWFAQTLRFVCLKNGANYAGSSFDCEYIILQYFEVMGRKDVPVNEIEKTPDGIRLSRERVHVKDSLVLAKFYGFCAVEALRGTVQLVGMSQYIQKLTKETDLKRHGST